jgi:hypothetical protein
MVWSDTGVMKGYALAVGLTCLALVQGGCALSGHRAPPPPDGLPADASGGLPADPVVLAVFKDRREMLLLQDGVPKERFEIRLGPRPEGHKLARGDNRTPEGSYRICTVKPSRFQSFLWLSYPNAGDAEEALEEGRLSDAQYRRIVQALDAGQCPPYDTPLGGLVGIHGDYEQPPRSYDWTEGCIALARNEDLLRLASLVRPGTPVVIYP